MRRSDKGFWLVLDAETVENDGMFRVVDWAVGLEWNGSEIDRIDSGVI